MWALRRLWRLPPRERRLLAEAAALLALFVVAIRVLPFAAARRLVARIGRARVSPPLPVERIAWAVAAAGRRVPGGTSCLAQALAAKALLARYGYRAELRIGVSQPGAAFRAHAWVETPGHATVGQTSLSELTALPPLPPVHAERP